MVELGNKIERAGKTTDLGKESFSSKERLSKMISEVGGVFKEKDNDKKDLMAKNFLNREIEGYNKNNIEQIEEIVAGVIYLAMVESGDVKLQSSLGMGSVVQIRESLPEEFIYLAEKIRDHVVDVKDLRETMDIFDGEYRDKDPSLTAYELFYRQVEKIKVPSDKEDQKIMILASITEKMTEGMAEWNDKKESTQVETKEAVEVPEEPEVPEDTGKNLQKLIDDFDAKYEGTEQEPSKEDYRLLLEQIEKLEVSGEDKDKKIEFMAYLIKEITGEEATFVTESDKNVEVSKESEEDPLEGFDLSQLLGSGELSSEPEEKPDTGEEIIGNAVKLLPEPKPEPEQKQKIVKESGKTSEIPETKEGEDTIRRKKLAEDIINLINSFDDSVEIVEVMQNASGDDPAYLRDRIFEEGLDGWLEVVSYLREKGYEDKGDTITTLIKNLDSSKTSGKKEIKNKD